MVFTREALQVSLETRPGAEKCSADSLFAF